MTCIYYSYFQPALKKQFPVLSSAKFLLAWLVNQLLTIAPRCKVSSFRKK
jgi:hypothetical protein